MKVLPSMLDPRSQVFPVAVEIGRRRPSRPADSSDDDDLEWTMRRIALANLDNGRQGSGILGNFVYEVTMRNLGMRGAAERKTANAKLAKQLATLWKDHKGDEQNAIKDLDPDEVLEAGFDAVKWRIRGAMVLKGIGTAALSAGALGAAAGGIAGFKRIYGSQQQESRTRVQTQGRRGTLRQDQEGHPPDDTRSGQRRKRPAARKTTAASRKRKRAPRR